jgi:hypothetical protein
MEKVNKMSNETITITVSQDAEHNIPKNIHMNTSDGMSASRAMTSLFAAVAMLTENIVRTSMASKYGDFDQKVVEETADTVAEPAIQFAAEMLSASKEMVDMILREIADRSFEEMQALAERLKNVESELANGEPEDA